MDNLPTVPDANAVPTAPIAPTVPVAPVQTPDPVMPAPTPAPVAPTPAQPTAPVDPSLAAQLPPSSSKKMIVIVVAILVVLGLAYVGYTSMTGSSDTSTTADTNSATPPSLTVKSNGLKGSFSDVESTYNCMQFKDDEVANFKPNPGDASADLTPGMNSLQIREDVSWLDAVKSIGPETGTACMAFYDTETTKFKIYPRGPFEGTAPVLQKDLATEKFKAGQTAILFVRKPGKAYKYFSNAKTKGAKTFIPAAGIKGWSLHIASKDTVKDELAQFSGRASKIFVQAMNEKEKKEEFVKVGDADIASKKFDYNFLYWVYLDTPAGGVTEPTKVAKITTVSQANIVMDPSTKTPVVNQTFDVTVAGENLDTTADATITTSDTEITVKVTKVEATKISFQITTTPKTTEGEKTFTVTSKGATVGTFKITASRLVDQTPSDMVFAPATIELKAVGANPSLTPIAGSITGKNLGTIASITTTYADITIVPATLEAKDVTSTEVKFGISVAVAAKQGIATFIAKDKAGKEIKSFTVQVAAAGAPTVAAPVIKSPINNPTIDTSKELKFEWTAVTTLPTGTTAVYVANMMQGVIAQDKFKPTSPDQDPTKDTNFVMPQQAVAQLPAGDYTYGVKTVAIDKDKKVIATSPWAVSSFTVPAASPSGLTLKKATDPAPLAPTDVTTLLSYEYADLSKGIIFKFEDPNTTSYVKDTSSGKYLSHYVYSIVNDKDVKDIPWTSGWETTESQTIIDKCQTKVTNEFTTPAKEAVYWTCKMGKIMLKDTEIAKFKAGNTYVLSVVAGDGNSPSKEGTTKFDVKGPSITSINPLKVTAKSSTKVTITGENLDPKTLEVIGSTPDAAKVLWLRNKVTGTDKSVEFSVGGTDTKAGTYKYQATMTDAAGLKKTLKEFDFTVDPFVTEIAKPVPAAIDPMTEGTISIEGKNFSVGSTIVSSKNADEKLQISVNGYYNTETKLVFDYKDTGAAEGDHVYNLEFNYKDGTSYKDEFTIHVNKNTTTITKIDPGTVEKAKDFVLTVTGTGFDKVNTARLTAESYYDLAISEKSDTSLKLKGNIFGDVADTIKEATISLEVAEGKTLATYKIKIGSPASGDVVKVGDILLAQWQSKPFQWTQAAVNAVNNDVATYDITYKDDATVRKGTPKTALTLFVNPTGDLKQYQKVVAKGRDGNVGVKDLFWSAHIIEKNADGTYKYGYDDELVDGKYSKTTTAHGLNWFYIPLSGVNQDSAGTGILP